MSTALMIPVRTIDLDMASVICQNNKESLYALLKRMDLQPEIQWDKEVMALYLRDTILDHPDYILSIFNKNSMEILLTIWESEEVEFLPCMWDVLNQLRLLGFVQVERMMENGKATYQIDVIEEGKEALYFYMKSRSARLTRERYHEWEQLIRGMISYYGIISFNRFYYLFCRMVKSPVDDREFHRFLSMRLDLHHVGSFAMETETQIEYFQNFEISEPEEVLVRRQENDITDFYLPEYDDVIYVGENNGIGSWKGVSELADIFLQFLEVEYYKTVIAVKTSILMIQNGETEDSVLEYLVTSYPECKNYQKDIWDAVRSLYRYVPVYELKGWCRQDRKQKHTGNSLFTVIKGGKKD